jgi:hypothetical protein
MPTFVVFDPSVSTVSEETQSELWIMTPRDADTDTSALGYS